MEDFGSISRRTFLTGSMAFASGLALEYLGGDFFSATPAYADSSSPEIKIIIVRDSEIGIVVYDMTNPKKPTAVADAKVTLTLRYNGKSLSGNSNAEGKIVFDITDLAEEDPDNTNLYPSFNGSITITKDGYRDVYIPLARISGHSAFVGATRPLDGKPYFRSLTLNEWDVQYTKPQFTKSDVNDEVHTLKGELWTPNPYLDLKVSLVFDKDGDEREIDDLNVVKREGDITTVELSDKFLCSSTTSSFNEEETPKIIIKQYGTSQEFETTVNVSVKEAPVKESKKLDAVVVPSALDHTLKVFLTGVDLVALEVDGLNLTLVDRGLLSSGDVLVYEQEVGIHAYA